MTIPSSIRITAKVTYEIVWAEIINDDPTTLGECRYESKQIVLKTGESETETYKTFLHEYVHCLEFEYKIKIPHKEVYKFEHALYNTLKLNGFIKPKKARRKK